MRKSTLAKLLVLLMLAAALVTAISFTASAEVPTKTLLDSNTEWKYLDNNTDPSAGLDSLQAWTAEDYNDAAWKSGKTSFGAAYDKTAGAVISKIEEKTPVNLLELLIKEASTTTVIPTYFFRTTFTVDDLDAYSHLVYTIDATGGAVVYLNGTVLTDTRLTTNDTTNLYYADASYRHKTFTYETKDVALKEGENTLAVELHAPKSTNPKMYFGIPEMKLIYEDVSDIVAEQLMMNVGASQSERNLAWFSGFEAAGEVRLAKASEIVDNVFPSEGYQTFAVQSRVAVNIPNRYAKSAVLTGLEPSAEYAYMIVGGGLSSQIYYFETGADGAFSFVYFGDPQLGNKTAHAEAWADTVDKIIENFDPEFLLSGGDQVDTGFNENIYANVFYQDEFATTPFAPTNGPGHDTYSSYDSTATFSDHYNLPNMSDTYGVSETKSYTITSNYYFTYNNALFISLNMLDKEAVTNGEHKAFIAEAIEKNPQAKWHIVIMHNSLFSTGLHGNPEYKNFDTEIGKYRPLMSAMFSELDVDVVLSAHDHVYVRSQMMDGDQVGDDEVIGNSVLDPEGVLYICANSSSGSKFYDQTVENASFVAKENYEKRKSAINIEITDTTFTLTTYFLDTMSAFDTFTIEKTSDEQQETNYSTPYGEIPEGDDSAIAVFDLDKNYLGGYDSLIDVFELHYSVTSNVVIYLRKSITQDEVDYDCGKAVGTKIIDLNGKTLTVNNRALFWTPAKARGDATITVKNGKINANGNKIWYTGGVDKASTVNKVMTVAFENVKFTNLSDSLVNDTLGAFYAYTNNLTFTDCTFQNVTAPLFNVGNTELGKINVKINGGSVNNTTTVLPTLLRIGDYQENVSVSFDTGKDGRGITLYVNKDESHPESISLPLQNDRICLVRSTAAETASQYVYVLAEQTPYGNIYEPHLGAPIVIFDSARNPIAALDNFLDVFEQYISVSGDVIIYLREDVSSDTLDFDAGKAEGEKIIDLGGHTLTVNTATFYYAQSKSPKNATLTFKNGTIDTNNKYFWRAGCSKASSAKKIITAVFESITFLNISKELVSDSIGGTETFHNDLTFNNCTFEVSSALTAPLFNLVTSDLGTMSVQVNGGKFILGNNAYNLFASSTDKKTLAFGDYNGAYPTFLLESTVDVSQTVEFTKDGAPLALYQSASNNGQSTYTLSPLKITKAYLNLTNDLNLVYRVFVPTGYENPTATFTVGTRSVTVSEYTVDENGLYCFTLSAIGPHRMQSTVTASVSATYGGKVYTATNATLSVKSYLDTVRSENSENTELIALIDALLVYGAAAEEYVGSTDTPLTEIGELSDIPEKTYTLTGVGFTKIGMRLESAIALRLGFASEGIEGMTLEVSRGDKTEAYALADYTAEDGTVTFLYDGITASALNEEITFTLKSADTVIGTLKLSANTYLYLASNLQDEKLTTLARALYAYGELARTYQE